MAIVSADVGVDEFLKGEVEIDETYL